MVKNCPYCGEEQRALKNHVRLAGGDGHGPSGQYPDDFDPESRRDGAGDDDDDDPGGQAAAALPQPAEPPSPDAGGNAVVVEAVEDTGENEPVPEDSASAEQEIVTLPQEEFEDVLDGAYEAGQQEAEPETGLGLEGPPAAAGQDEPAFDSPETDDDVIDVEATPVDDSNEESEEETGEQESSGGLSLGKVLMWIIVLPLLAVVALAALALDPEDSQNQDPFGRNYGTGGLDDVDVV